ncbi:GIN domain-containing protein [Flavobacterium sp. GNP001]
MKKYAALLLLLCFTIATAQKKEKIKGNKIVTVENRSIADFERLEIEDNLEINLERGEKADLKIEADENLQDGIKVEERDGTLRIYSTKNATSYKKLLVRITYTAALRQIMAKGETKVTAIQELLLPSMNLEATDNAALFMNINATNFEYKANDKVKAELNIKTEKCRLELSKNATVKALINATDLQIDQYQKSEAKIEGDATTATIRLDNNATLTANKLTMKNVTLVAEGYTTSAVNASSTITISASTKAEVQLIGNPKIELNQFSDEARLIKKLK